MGNYSIVDNKIINFGFCEVYLSQHCNLACRTCQHLSPIYDIGFFDIRKIVKDLNIAKKYYRPHGLKILGGEPLLYPKICDALKAIRETQFADKIRICTNGVLLHKMPMEFWNLFDELEISVYPGREPDMEYIKKMAPMLEERKVMVLVANYSHFREGYTEVGTKDEKLVKKIYDSCHIVHTWKSHAIVNGRFYKCPESYFISNGLKERFSSSNPEGIEISDDSDFSKRLLDFLEAKKPLETCKVCLGTSGKNVVHEQQRNKILWRDWQKKPTEELIDYEQMERCREEIENKKPEAIMGNNKIQYLTKYKSFGSTTSDAF
jgi:organic radical activating enzyme